MRCESCLVEMEILQRPLDAHEKGARLDVLVLVRIKIVATVLGQRIGNGRDQSLTVRRVQKKDCACAHRRAIAPRYAV